MFGAPTATIATIEHEKHQLRRKVLSTFFSKRAISAAQPLIQQKVEKFIALLRKSYEEGTVVNLHEASMTLTLNIISHYSYGQPCGFLNDQESGKLWKDSIKTILAMGQLLRFLPVNISRLKSIPIAILQRLEPGSALILGFHKKIREEAITSMISNADNQAEQATIFKAISHSKLSAEEKVLSRLEDDGWTILAAGSETTANVLAVTIFHLLDTRDSWLELRNELNAAIPTPSKIPVLSELEALPFLVRIEHSIPTCELSRIMNCSERSSTRAFECQ